MSLAPPEYRPTLRRLGIFITCRDHANQTVAIDEDRICTLTSGETESGLAVCSVRLTNGDEIVTFNDVGEWLDILTREDV